MPLRRAAGVLLHVSSLPGNFGTGDFGPAAHRFAACLAESGFSVWQVLPLTPTSSAFGNSPYSSPSAFAGSVLFVSPELLLRDGLIDESMTAKLAVEGSERADYDLALGVREAVLAEAWKKFCREPESFAAMQEEFSRFLEDERGWLDDFALFSALRKHFGDRCWTEWPDEYRFRDGEALDAFALEQKNAEYISFVCFCQFICNRQLQELRAVCRGRGVSLLGDMPMFVALDSPDVWAHRDLFDLDGECRQNCVAGVPPDYFSATGQRWGNPLYNWDAMAKDGFSWWRARMKRALAMCDLVRVDHFRGFCGYWAIPAAEQTAAGGSWRQAPGEALMKSFAAEFGRDGGTLPLVAEDLGVITDDVRALMDEFSLPGMKVLQFAFGEGIGSNPYIPHNIVKNSVVYTGTHDNNTTRGWWENEASETEKNHFRAYAGCEPDGSGAARQMTRLALASAADLAVIPMQDLLALDGSSRMNKPATCVGNWCWRLTEQEFEAAAAAGEMQKMKELNRLFGRTA